VVDYAVKFLTNFAFIFASMALFFAPFVAVFWWRNRHDIRASKPHFNFFMEQFFTSRESDYLVLAWAALEALVWFIIPEFLLILIVFMKVHRKVNLVKFDIIGTAIGTFVGLGWVMPEQVLLQVPYIYPKMLEQVHKWYEQHGVWGLAFQPFSGVPYKVFIEQASSHHFFVVTFLAIAVVARISRYVIAYQLTIGLYPLAHRFVRKHYAILFAFASAIFTALLLRVTQIYG
jgi:hypothetical protein